MIYMNVLGSLGKGTTSALWSEWGWGFSKLLWLTPQVHQISPVVYYHSSTHTKLPPPPAGKGGQWRRIQKSLVCWFVPSSIACKESIKSDLISIILFQYHFSSLELWGRWTAQQGSPQAGRQTDRQTLGLCLVWMSLRLLFLLACSHPSVNTWPLKVSTFCLSSELSWDKRWFD